jgi:hypothetical protein
MKSLLLPLLEAMPAFGHPDFSCATEHDLSVRSNTSISAVFFSVAYRVFRYTRGRPEFSIQTFF